MSAYILLAIGLILIFIEFYLPGAVIGIAGGLFVLASIIIFATQTQSAIAVAAYICATILCLVYLIKFALWRIRSTKPDKSIYSDHSQNGYVASKFDKTAIGKKGVVLSDLKPGGYIIVEGKQHQAISISGYIVKGTEVEIIGGEEESLIVKLTKKEMLS